MDRATDITRIIAEQANREPAELTRDTRLGEDLGLDSLDEVELAVTLEDTFDIRCIPDERLSGCRTVGDVIKLIIELLDGEATDG